jgi:hypothetical protein
MRDIMPKRIVVHAGPSKTGTSAIQYWLTTNQDLLVQQGVLYPAHGVDTNNVSSGNMLSVLSSNKKNGWYVDKKKVSSLLNEFNESEAEILLLSSEFFYQLIQEIYEMIPDVEFLLYLRCPLQILESSYNQTVKRSKVTHHFFIPDNFQFLILNQLEELLNDNKKINLIIRPYGQKIFEGGSIINDFMAAIGLNLQVNAPEKINTSYTLQTLEFARCCNFLELGLLATPLDQILQKCNIGINDYTLINEEKITIVRKRLSKELENFSRIQDFSNLQNLAKSIKSGESRPFLTQKTTLKEMEAVAEFIAQESPILYKFIVKASNQTPIDNFQNDNVFEALNTVNVTETQVLDISNYMKLAQKLLSNQVQDEADVCREIALFFETEGEFKTASSFMAAAHTFRPTGPFIASKLSEYQNRAIKSDEGIKKQSN